MNDNRDYESLQDKTKAYYNFRGYNVMGFDKNTKEFFICEGHKECSFITEDLKYMSVFLMDCYNFATGKTTTVESMCVD